MLCRTAGDFAARRLTHIFGGRYSVCKVIETVAVGRCIAPHGILKIMRRIFGVRLIDVRMVVSNRN